MHPKYWNDKFSAYKDAIRKSYPEAFRQELIQKLLEWETKYSGSANELAVDDVVGHTVKDVAEKVSQKRSKAAQALLLKFIEDTLESMRRAGQNGNADIYKEIQLLLKRFIKDEYALTEIRFDKVTVKFCHDLETYLRERGNSENTIHQRFRVLRAIFNRAIAVEVAKPDHYPFARNAAEKHKFQLGKFSTKTSKRAISRTDVRKIEEYKVPTESSGLYASLRKDNERLQLAKDVFLFSFYVGGINFVDLAALQWDNISTDVAGFKRINYTRQKTGGRFSIRLTKPALEILERYKVNNNPDNVDYIFPILSKQKHTTPLQVKNRCHKVLGEVNANLKTIAQSAEIDVTLTSYVARHSFASALKRAGVATAVISEAMGHSTESVTQTYLTSFESETLDSAFDALL